MTKRVCVLLISFLLGINHLLAVPAYPKPIRVQQPDGSHVTIRLHGDEYLHFTTTVDNYTLVKNDKGYYVYADYHQGSLIPTSMVAHDTDSRSRSESEFVAGITKQLKPTITISNHERRNTAISSQRRALKSPPFDFGNFRGLVVLVEFNDRSFSRDDYPQIANDMLNCENYSGYDNSHEGQFTGSVRDYFYDNSFGQFSPQFDVVGPVKIDYSQYDANGSDNALPLILAAVDAADDIVDYSLYDGDHDGWADPVHFIFAGYGSHCSDDSRLIWPHEWEVYTDTWSRITRDGVKLKKYACSTELIYSSCLSGIGSICHEFSHALGLMDLYDVDYEGSGGTSYTPDSWSVMDAGCYNNNERTPPAFSLYERYALGFTTPITISEEGNFQLESIETSNTGFRLDTPVENEFFLLENRQQNTKWDANLPGHGMLVFRVDSTNANIWRMNVVNNNPEHNYFEILRAGGEKYDYRSDPFPGSKNVTSLTNETSPANLLTWNKTPNQLGLRNIKETDDTISFAVVDVTNPTYSLYKLTYLIDGEVYKTYEIEYGATITPEAEPTKEGYSFSGWNYIPSKMPAKDVLVVGTFTQEALIKDGIIYEIDGDNVTVTHTDNAQGEIIIEASVVINGQSYNVTAIAEGAFQGCTGLTSVEIPSSITTIGKNAFDGCMSLTLIKIGKGIKDIGSKAFANIAKNAARTRGDNEGLKVYCETEVIPSTAADAFENTPIDKGTLIVDDELVNVYKLVTPWNGFGSIIGLTTDIRPVDIESDKAFIFDMQGNRVDNVRKGVNIIRTKNGKIQKFVVK